MKPRCPDCGSHDALSFVAEVGQNICSDCGTVSQELQLYQPSSIHDVAFALGIPWTEHRSHSGLEPLGPPRHPFWSHSSEDSRRINDLQRKPEVDARILGTLSTLGHPGLFDQTDFLFGRARKASWQTVLTENQEGNATLGDGLEQDAPIPSTSSAHFSSNLIPSSLIPRRVRWGNDSLLLATACCYAILRQEGIRIDLQTVSAAAHLDYSKVRRAFKLLKLLVSDAVRTVKLANPDAYVHRILGFFQANLSAETSLGFNAKLAKFVKPLRGPSNVRSASALVNKQFERMEATAFDLCTFWWPQRNRYATDPQLAAFAVVVLAIEAHIKAPAPIYDIFHYTYPALQSDTTIRDDDNRLSFDAPLSKQAIALYGELCSALKQEASKIPWLADTKPTLGKQRAKKRSASSNSPSAELLGETDLVRRDLIVHVLDILDVQRALRSKQKDVDQANGHVKTDPISSALQAAYAANIDDNQRRLQQNTLDSSELDIDEGELGCFVSSNELDNMPNVDAMIAEQEAADHSQAKSQASGDVVPSQDDVWSRLKARLETNDALPDLDAARKSSGSGLHPIDLLSDDQVDDLLFDPEELSSVLRTDPAELLAFERAKIVSGDWPAVSEHQRNLEFTALAQTELTDQPKRPPRKVKKDLKAAAETARNDLKRGQRAGKRPMSQAKKRTRRLSNVSLRQQQEESDWSD